MFLRFCYEGGADRELALSKKVHGDCTVDKIWAFGHGIVPGGKGLARERLSRTVSEDVLSRTVVFRFGSRKKRLAGYRPYPAPSPCSFVPWIPLSGCC